MNQKISAKPDAVITDQHPVDVLIQFMREMNQWEKQRWKEHEEIELRAYRKNIIRQLRREYTRMTKIFAKYCTPKKRMNNHVGAYSLPVQYDPDNEIILETVIESSRRAVIYAKQKLGFRLYHKFVLLRKGRQWLIDNRQWRVNSNQKWKRGIL